MQITADIDVNPLELDHREGDGIAVSLLWHKHLNAVSIAVRDDRTGDELAYVVPPDRALDAFHHPYAYAAGQGLLAAPEYQEPVYA
jgi:hypothetical protein